MSLQKERQRWCQAFVCVGIYRGVSLRGRQLHGWILTTSVPSCNAIWSSPNIASPRANKYVSYESRKRQTLSTVQALVWRGKNRTRIMPPCWELRKKVRGREGPTGSIHVRTYCDDATRHRHQLVIAVAACSVRIRYIQVYIYSGRP